ncbi:MAG: FecR domain-containing protein [Armatimonadota bacterium]
MRPAATIFIFAALLMIVVLIFLSHSLAIVQRVAVVDTLEGDTSLLRQEKPQTLKLGQLVHAGDVIRTGADSSVELRWARWAGGTRIKLGADTKFTVKRAVTNRSSGEEESRLRVDQGSIWVRLRKALTGKSKFEVETPTAVAAVRGTVFKVAVDPNGASRISVWKGTVAVEPTEGGAVSVTDGASVTVGGAIGGAPETMTEAEQEEWQNQTSVIGPFLQLDLPYAGQQLQTNSLTIVGRTEPDCSVTVNGVSAAVSEKGEFSTTADMPPGVQLIEVTSTAPDGTQTTITRTVSVL